MPSPCTDLPTELPQVSGSDRNSPGDVGTTERSGWAPRKHFPFPALPFLGLLTLGPSPALDPAEVSAGSAHFPRRDRLDPGANCIDINLF